MNGNIETENRLPSRDEIMAVLRLLKPKLRFHREILVLGDRSDAEADELIDMWMRELDGDLSAVERVINHVHVADLLLNVPCIKNISDDELRLVTEAYAAMLEFEIRRVADGRKYEIFIEGMDSTIPQVTFPDGHTEAYPEAANIEVSFNLLR